jgi:cell wall-associated NlpC family hydrolase
MRLRQLKPLPAPDDGSRVEGALSMMPRRLRITGGIAAACAAIAAVVALVAGGSDGRGAATASATPQRVAAAVPNADAAQAEQPPPLKSHPKVAVALPPGQAPPVDPSTVSSSGSAAPVAQSDAEVRQELALFRKHLASFSAARGPVPAVRSDGTAVAPLQAPSVVAAVIGAGNAIATTPYKWGGGHGAWKDNGYDCSGSVSFALAGAGLMSSPLTSGSFMSWGDAGPGRWITIYANNGHVFMVVAGLRFDTSGANGGTRWQSAKARSYSGFAVRHPPGL